MTQSFSESMVAEALLFSVDPSGRGVEVTTRGFEFSDEIAPLFEGSKVLKPVPVMVEGEYHLYDQSTRSWKRVSISAADVEQYLANTPRDVAINYEHKREGEPKGWLRLKDTGYTALLQTKNGLKRALFAAIELFEGAANDVRKGLFRDVSIELKPISREIQGTALTGYPIMRDVQFYSADVVADSETPASPERNDGATDATGSDGSPPHLEGNSAPGSSESDGGAPDPLITEADIVNVPATLDAPSFADTSDSPPLADQETPMTDQEKQALLAAELQKFGLTPEDLTSLPEALASMRREQAELKFASAREHIKATSTDAQGNIKIAPGAIDAAAQLYAFCQENDTVNFSVGNEQVTPAQLFDALMAGIQSVQVYGATTDDDGAPVADAVGAVPNVNPDEVLVDKDNVASLVSRMKSTIKANGL